MHITSKISRHHKAHTHTHTHARTCTCTHTHTHTHIHTHTHTHMNTRLVLNATLHSSQGHCRHHHRHECTAERWGSIAWGGKSQQGLSTHTNTPYHVSLQSSHSHLLLPPLTLSYIGVCACSIFSTSASCTQGFLKWTETEARKTQVMAWEDAQMQQIRGTCFSGSRCSCHASN